MILDQFIKGAYTKCKNCGSKDLANAGKLFGCKLNRPTCKKCYNEYQKNKYYEKKKKVDGIRED